jgi:hypothetical protein
LSVPITRVTDFPEAVVTPKRHGDSSVLELRLVQRAFIEYGWLLFLAAAVFTCGRFRAESINNSVMLAQARFIISESNSCGFT